MASFVIGDDGAAAGGTVTGIASGDVIVFYCYRSGSNSLPGLPAELTGIVGANGTNSISSRFAYAVSAGTDFTYTAWTSGAGVTWTVWRPGASETLTFGATSSVNTAASGDVSYDGFTPEVSDGSSIFIGGAAIRVADSAIQTAPTGMTARANFVGGSSEAGLHDTNGGAAGWSTQTVTQGGTAGAWCSRVIEMKVTAVAKTVVAGAGSYAVTGSAATLKIGRKVAAAAGSYAVSGTAATLVLGKILAAAAGAYAVTGSAAALRTTRVITAGAGSYAVAGTDAGLTLASGVSAPSPYYRAANRRIEGRRYDSVLGLVQFERRTPEPLRKVEEQVEAILANPEAPGVGKQIAALERTAREIEGLAELVETRIARSERLERLTAILDWLEQQRIAETEQIERIAAEKEAALFAEIEAEELLLLMAAV